MRKIVCVFVLIFAVMILPVSAFAAENTDELIVGPSDGFIKVCDSLFAGNGEVYSSSGANITRSFVLENSAAYNSNDYATILTECYSKDVSQIRTHSKKPSTRAIMNIPYEESVVHFITQNGFPYDGKSWYLLVTASGTYAYNDGYQYIQNFPAPVISVSFHDLGALFSGSLTSMSVTAPAFNSSKTSVSFTVTTTHTVSCPIPGSDYVTGTLGPFKNVSNFTINAIG